ncbi:MAG: hypothetical protein AVDCRST_MAG05-4558, partial [uncultured Rubrobacteraceae bacterium]
ARRGRDRHAQRPGGRHPLDLGVLQGDRRDGRRDKAHDRRHVPQAQVDYQGHRPEHKGDRTGRPHGPAGSQYKALRGRQAYLPDQVRLHRLDRRAALQVAQALQRQEDREGGGHRRGEQHRHQVLVLHDQV